MKEMAGEKFLKYLRGKSGVERRETEKMANEGCREVTLKPLFNNVFDVLKELNKVDN